MTDSASSKARDAWTSECGRARLYLGDCLDVLPSLPRRSRVAVYDPPYSSGGFNEAGKANGSIGSTAGAKILNDTMSSEGYTEMLRRSVRLSGAHSAYIFTDWRMWGFTRAATELAGMRVRGMLAWDKLSSGMGSRWLQSHELVLWGSRMQMVSPNAAPNVLRFKRSGNANHPTEKPVSLMRAIVRNAEPGEIVDAFCGSASTGVAALLEGRAFIGIEDDPKHFETAVMRLRETLREMSANPAAFATVQSSIL